jgi:hypothetical protein
MLEPEGVPITAERAKEVFGCKAPDRIDYTRDLRRWKAAAWYVGWRRFGVCVGGGGGRSGGWGIVGG